MRFSIFLIVCMLILGTARAEIAVTTYINEQVPSQTYRKANLLRGLRPVIGEAGLKLGSPELLTDGDLFTSAAVCADAQGRRFPSPTTCTVLTFALRHDSDIGAIRVFSAWFDIRAYHCYDVEVASAPLGVYSMLAHNVRVGPDSGLLKVGSDPFQRSMSSIVNPGGGAIAKRVYQIRFTFWPVGMQDSQNRSVFSPRGKGHDGTCLTEIEVLPPNYLKLTDADVQ